MKVQCTTQEWVFVHVHVDYITKYRQRCIDIEKNGCIIAMNVNRTTGNCFIKIYF